MKYWIWLTQIPNIGPVLSNRLLEKFEDPVEIYKADEKSLRSVKGINMRHVESIKNARSLEKAEEILDKCHRQKISILTKENHQYPRKGSATVRISSGNKTNKI